MEYYLNTYSRIDIFPIDTSCPRRYSLPKAVLRLDVVPHSLYPEYPQYLVTYTFENPTSALLGIDVHFESTIECGVSGPNSFRLTLLAFTSYELKLIVIPVKEEWARLPQIIVFDSERKRMVELFRATDDLKIEGGDLFLRVPSTK